MNITFPDRHELRSEVIEFPAIVDGSRMVVCKITIEEMGREFCHSTPRTFESDFRQYRSRIEDRAARMIREKDAMD